jgi:hypothetical protein
VTRVRSGEPEEDRSGRISLVTSQEEEDVVAVVLDASSIPSMQMKRTTLRTSWCPWVGAQVTTGAGRRRGGGSDVWELAEQKKTRGKR